LIEKLGGMQKLEKQKETNQSLDTTATAINLGEKICYRMKLNPKKRPALL
jgi:hypothetical protein